MQKDTVLPVRMTAQTAEILEELARREDRSRASIIRRLIEREGKAQGFVSNDQASTAQPASEMAEDRLRHWTPTVTE